MLYPTPTYRASSNVTGNGGRRASRPTKTTAVATTNTSDSRRSERRMDIIADGTGRGRCDDPRRGVASCLSGRGRPRPVRSLGRGQGPALRGGFQLARERRCHATDDPDIALAVFELDGPAFANP